MRDERLVEDRVDAVAVVRRLLVQPPHPHALEGAAVRRRGERGVAPLKDPRRMVSVQGHSGSPDEANCGMMRAMRRDGGRVREAVVADERDGSVVADRRGPPTRSSRDEHGGAGRRPRRAGDAVVADLLVGLRRDGGDPLRRQLAAELRAAIRAGRLRTGVRLPASRALAAQLGVSRGVVTDAYEQLGAEGWLAARRGAGTVVAAAPAARPPGRSRAARRSVRADFTPTTPDVAQFPRRLWARAVAHAAATAPDAALDYGDGHGAAAAPRRARRLSRPRPRHGRRAWLDRRLRRLPPGDRAALRRARAARRAPHRVRGPSLPDHWDTAVRAGLEPVAVPVDDGGLRVDALAATGAGAVVATPSHQYPTGAVMGPERRHALLAWAREGGRLSWRTTTRRSSATTGGRSARSRGSIRSTSRMSARRPRRSRPGCGSAGCWRRPGSRPRWPPRSSPPITALPRSTSSPSRT